MTAPHRSMRGRLDNVCRWLSLAGTGVLTGIFAGGVLTAAALRTQPATIYAPVSAAIHHTYALAMSILLLTTVVATAARLALRPPRAQLGLLTVATIGLIVVTALSVLVNVPINGQMIDEWPIEIPADWAAVRDRWNSAHLVRTGAAAIAFACLVTAHPARDT